MPDDNGINTCSFCGKSSAQVFRLITSDGCKICNECIGRCAEIIAREYRSIAHEMQFMPPDNGGVT